jgi:Phasin protein
MTETQTHAGNPFSFADKAFPFAFDRSEIAAFGKKRMETFVNVQSELIEEIQEANRHWLDRIQSEANLAAEYASKLSSVRSIPDAMAVSRDWSAQYLQRLADDGKHIADDTRKFIETGARLFSHEFERPAAVA